MAHFSKESQYLYGGVRNQNFSKHIFMAKSHWLINPNRTEVKRFLRNDKSIDGVFEYMFVDTGKIVNQLEKKPPLMTTSVSVDIDLAREIYERLLSQGWRKTEQVWGKET